MFTTSVEFGQTVVPASAHTIHERKRRIKAALSHKISISKNNQTASPLSGNWTLKEPKSIDANPAGIRIPKEFKKR